MLLLMCGTVSRIIRMDIGGDSVLAALSDDYLDRKVHKNRGLVIFL
jgi:hypothetical protein